MHIRAPEEEQVRHPHVPGLSGWKVALLRSTLGTFLVDCKRTKTEQQYARVCQAQHFHQGGDLYLYSALMRQVSRKVLKFLHLIDAATELMSSHLK